MARVGVNVRIGDNVLINVGTQLAHGVTVCDHVHCSVGVISAGPSILGEGACLGMGVRVLPAVRIGAWSVCGAGAVVTRDVPARATVVGVPARLLRQGDSA